MLNPLIRTLVKVVVASLIVGTILAHFGITADTGGIRPVLRSHRGVDAPRPGLGSPNLLLGAMVILPVWFLLYLFRPPGAAARSRTDARSMKREALRRRVSSAASPAATRGTSRSSEARRRLRTDDPIGVGQPQGHLERPTSVRR